MYKEYAKKCDAFWKKVTCNLKPDHQRLYLLFLESFLKIKKYLRTCPGYYFTNNAFISQTVVEESITQINNYNSEVGY